MNYLLRHKNGILVASTVLVVLCILSVLLIGFKPGIDFTSGSLWQVRMAEVDSTQIRDIFREEFGIEELNISVDEAENIYAFTYREVSEDERQVLLSDLRERFGEVEDLDFSTISPSISSELREKAYIAIVLVLIGISMFIAFAFRKVSEPIKSWKYGLITLITLFHDVAIPAGVFVLLGYFAGVTVDTNFIVAILFVMGFSVNDTIVVFDRIRENLLTAKEERRREELKDIIDKSIRETIARSINTSLTLIVILVAIFFLGPASTKMFILAILIGSVVGTYSSLFFASPLLLFAEKLSRNPQ